VGSSIGVYKTTGVYKTELNYVKLRRNGDLDEINQRSKAKA